MHVYSHQGVCTTTVTLGDCHWTIATVDNNDVWMIPHVVRQGPGYRLTSVITSATIHHHDHQPHTTPHSPYPTSIHPI